MSFLKINNLSVDYKMRRETVYAAKNINIEVSKGEILGLVGESGSGKSTLMTIVGCLGQATSGTDLLDGEDVGQFNDRQLSRVRNEKIGFVFQDIIPMCVLDRKHIAKYALQTNGYSRFLRNPFL